MKKIGLWITLGLGTASSASYADFAYHYDFWSRTTPPVYGSDEQTVGSGNQCVIYSKISYEYDGRHELPFIQGLRDGEIVSNLDWGFGATRNYRVSKVDAWGQAHWTDNIDRLYYTWWDNILGYGLSKGCSLTLTTEDNFHGNKEIVLPRPTDDRAFSGAEKITEINLIFPAQNTFHPTKGNVNSIACSCKDKVPTPILPTASVVEAVKASIRSGNSILRDIEKAAQDLSSNLNLAKTRLQTFKERYDALGNSEATLKKITDTATTLTPDDLFGYEAAYRPFSNQNCSSSLIRDNFEALAALETKGNQLIEKYRLEYADQQDGTDSIRKSMEVFAAARKIWKIDRSSVTQNYNAHLRGCQITGKILEGIPQRIRYEKLTKLNAAFKGIADGAIEAIDEANRSLKQYSVKIYWDAEFTKRLNTLSALRLGSYLSKMDSFSLELAEWYLQFRELIKEDPSMTEPDVIALLTRYDKLLKDEKKLYTEKRALGAKILVTSRIENRFNSDLLLKIRKHIHTSPVESKPDLLNYYARVVQNAGFPLPSDCELVDTAVKNAACWKIKVNGTLSDEDFEVYDPQLDVLEDALKTKFQF